MNTGHNIASTTVDFFNSKDVSIIDIQPPGDGDWEDRVFIDAASRVHRVCRTSAV